MLIDAHHHLWRLSRGDYGWITPDTGFLFRDFEPEDFKPLLDRHGIQRSVLIQAAPSVDETRFLLSLAERHDWIAAVVGWVDFADPGAATVLDDFSAHPKFRGVRPMIQDIAEDAWLLRPELRPTYEALAARGLRFDALVQPRHLAHLVELVARHPGLRVVIDHCGKPEVRDWSPGDADFAAWARHMRVLAGSPDVFCKFSALPTRAGAGWTRATFAPYAEVLLTAFGPERLMWASDWPVLERNGEYGHWFETARELIPPAGHDAVFGGTAQAFYAIPSIQPERASRA